MSGEFQAHDGTGCPFPVGAVVETLHRDGMRRTRTVQQGSLCTGAFIIGDRPFLSAWAWAVNGRPECQAYTDIIAYRPIDKFREQRTAMFRRLLDAPAPEVEVA